MAEITLETRLPTSVVLDEPRTTTRDVAMRLVAMCREGRHDDAIRALYAPHVESWEAMEPMRLCRGRDAVLAKAAWWQREHDVHAATVEGPYVNGEEFAVRFSYDFTRRATGERVTMDEIGVYRVEDGRVVEERFLY
jgi:ketosteroid isomerase-like protein